MKIKSYIFSIFLPIILIINFSLADATSNSLDQEVKSTMNNVMHEFNIPGAAIVIYKDGQMHQYLFGVMNKINKHPVTNQTIFELGSVTKSFTGLLLAEQINAGIMTLDDSLTKYLNPNAIYSKNLQQITLLELATHTSSLPFNAPNLSYNAASTPQNKKIFNRFLQNWQAPYTPGTAILYSNFGFSMLGYALTKQAQTPLFDAVEKGILEPLNMQNSYFTIPKDMMKNYSQGYTALDAPSRTPQEGMLPSAWAMKSSISDMTQYLRAAIGISNVPNKILAAIKIAQTGYFQLKNGKQSGLGWTIIPLSQIDLTELLKKEPILPRKKSATPIDKINSPHYISNALIEKTGATNGFRAYIGVIPSQKLGVVILVNKFTADSHAIEHVGREIIFSQ